MKRILFCLLLLTPTLALADDLRCGEIPPQVAAAEYACDQATGEWVQRPEAPIVLAQAPTPTTTEAPADDTPTEGEDPPQVGELVSDAGKVIDDWRNIGWLAGVIALINLLLSLMRFTPIETWLDELDYKWIKPLIATLLGCAFGGFSTYQTGAGVLNSIVVGALAGLGSVGFHELFDKTRKRTTKAKPATAEG